MDSSVPQHPPGEPGPTINTAQQTRRCCLSKLYLALNTDASAHPHATQIQQKLSLLDNHGQPRPYSTWQPYAPEIAGHTHSPGERQQVRNQPLCTLTRVCDLDSSKENFPRDSIPDVHRTQTHGCALCVRVPAVNSQPTTDSSTADVLVVDKE